MKKTLIAIFLSAGISQASEMLSERVNALIPALIMVESGGRPDAIGDGGKAVGILQIHMSYLHDVNRIIASKKIFHDRDRKNVKKSMEMARAYLVYYGKHYERKNNKVADYEILARIHNGGPYGWKKEATLKYWDKVKKAMR